MGLRDRSGRDYIGVVWHPLPSARDLDGMPQNPHRPGSLSAAARLCRAELYLGAFLASRWRTLAGLVPPRFPAVGNPGASQAGNRTCGGRPGGRQIVSKNKNTGKVEEKNAQRVRATKRTPV